MWARRRRQGTDPLTCLLLETLPPLFSVCLITSLSWASYSLTPPEYVPLILLFQIQIIAQCIQFHRYASIVPTSAKNFPGYVHRYPSLTGRKEETQTTKWEECESCDMHVPISSRHCSHCRKCIRLKDHHCYFLGACVGSHNKRFFLAFVLYAALGSLFATLAILNEMSMNRNLFSWDGFSLFLPVNIAMYFYGQSSRIEIFYVSLLNFGIGAFLFTTFMLFMRPDKKKTRHHDSQKSKKKALEKAEKASNNNKATPPQKSKRDLPPPQPEPPKITSNWTKLEIPSDDENDYEDEDWDPSEISEKYVLEFKKAAEDRLKSYEETYMAEKRDDEDYMKRIIDGNG
ncbi:ZDHHC [Lepeophtheirus salmonis]|uniref:Palmitoyltransferase n=1 Tax=Lepeophtheirus salmonis TaxID=72036 RepID=A0A7R8CX00_LEPSM|nr:ZDHHC [Lepeophtheirus salmonis]CAF2956400.1 ZDHHC [Lepeophtheirus salmonis]